LNNPPTREAQINTGTSLYSQFILSIYDWYVLWYNCRFLWKCPAHNLLDLYNSHVSANHLDIGVGTGYFMDKCKFPNNSIRLALMDSDANSLRAASKRLIRYKPEEYQRNVTESFDINAPAFDSIGMMNLLHCIPGDLKTKAIVFEHAKAVMNPGAVIFGSTILYKGIKRNTLATLAIKYYNKKGFMFNMNDCLEDLQESLRSSFSDSSVRVIGCEALFWARK
jgi:ubiquinone/menaquinone biosynthesis C-methylase UbiE